MEGIKNYETKEKNYLKGRGIISDEEFQPREQKFSHILLDDSVECTISMFEVKNFVGLEPVFKLGFSHTEDSQKSEHFFGDRFGTGHQ